MFEHQRLSTSYLAITVATIDCRACQICIKNHDAPNEPPRLTLLLYLNNRMFHFRPSHCTIHGRVSGTKSFTRTHTHTLFHLRCSRSALVILFLGRWAESGATDAIHALWIPRA